jgi:hypothetical protein
MSEWKRCDMPNRGRWHQCGGNLSDQNQINRFRNESGTGPRSSRGTAALRGNRISRGNVVERWQKHRERARRLRANGPRGKKLFDFSRFEDHGTSATFISQSLVAGRRSRSETSARSSKRASLGPRTQSSEVAKVEAEHDRDAALVPRLHAWGQDLRASSLVNRLHETLSTCSL